jgi:hypothetical protein
MLVTNLTRWRRAMERRGFERVGENGGRIWELHRGLRTHHKIVACEIDPDGRELWIKIEPDAAQPISKVAG